MTETLLWFAIWSTALLGLGMLRGNTHKSKAIKILLLPGFLLESVLRSISSLLTVTPIERFSPFSTGRPILETRRSKLGPMGLVLNVVLRFVLLVFLVYYCATDMPRFLQSGFALPLLDLATVTEQGVNWGSFGLFARRLADLPQLLGLSGVGSMLLFYTLLSTLYAAALDRREWGAAILAIGACAVVGSGFGWLGMKFGFLSRGWYIHAFYAPEVWTTISLMIFSTLALVIAVALARVFVLMTPTLSYSDSKPAPDPS